VCKPHIPWCIVTRVFRRKRSRGQSLVEFALVLPILVILLFGTIQVGVTYGGYNGLINSVREAARYGSVCTGSTAPGCGNLTATHLLQGINTAVFAFKSGSPNAVVTYGSYQDAAGKYNIQMTVTGCLKGIIFIPFIGNLLSWTDPTGVYLKSTEVFRVEGQPSVGPPTLPAASTNGGACS
jgi:TadE-like protein